MKQKKTVVILYGGDSTEHEISCRSAKFLIDFMDEDKYNIVPVGIDQQGAWWPQSFHSLKNYPGTTLPIEKNQKSLFSQAALSPNPRNMLYQLSGIDLTIGESDPAEVIFFPMLHGSPGEDGKIQGLFELARVPFVGCDTLSSSMSMSKLHTKLIAESLGLLVTPYQYISQKQWFDNPSQISNKLFASLGPNLIVKPNSLGSAVGINKAQNESDLAKAMAEGFTYDEHLLVESFISPMRELECAVLIDEAIETCDPAEIVCEANTFYTYDEKYHSNSKASVQVPAKIDETLSQKIQKQSTLIAERLNCSGMVRVDWFYDTTASNLYFNEANPIPGFTSISVFPKACMEKGYKENEIIDFLIRSAMTRFNAKIQKKNIFLEEEKGSIS